MPGQARMLVECGPEAVLAAVTVKKSATENSQLNKQRSYRHVGRYSGSFSPPGDHILDLQRIHRFSPYYPG